MIYNLHRLLVQGEEEERFEYVEARKSLWETEPALSIMAAMGHGLGVILLPLGKSEM